MDQMKTTAHHVVVVRNSAGRIVHTHQVIEFEGATPMSEPELFEAALAAAKRVPGQEQGELTPAISTEEELERLRANNERGPGQSS